MLLLRSMLVIAMIGCALAAAGCSMPWTTPPTFASPTPPTATASASSLPVAEIDADPDLTVVFDQLAQIRAIDPAAEQKLLEELRRTPPKSWPLMAEQFRASLAFREQLNAKKQRSHPAAEAAPANEPPSTLFGALVDPRTAYADRLSDPTQPPSLHHATQSSTANRNTPVELATGSLPGQKSAPFPVQQTGFEFPSNSGEPESLDQPDRLDSPTVKPLTDSLTWQQHLERAAEELNRSIAPSPTTTAEIHQHVSLRLLRLLAGDTERALQPIPNIPPSEQDYWSRQIFALASYLDHHSQPDDKRRAAASVTHLDEAVAHLREIGSLSLRNLSFCKNIYGYGAIEPYETNRFSPGDQVSLYVEIENYYSQSTEKGFCTLLGSSYELLGEKGERIAGGDFPDVEDCCGSRRRDFHIQYGLTLPASLGPGEYRLQVVVKDRQSDKIGSASVAFEIRGRVL